jgi:heme oxygenase
MATTLERKDTEVKEESARQSGLALLLDDGTRKSHSLAENTQFVSGFFKGISSQQAFKQLVASLYFVYAEMEKAFDESEDPNVKALDFPELRRLPALEEDMAYYFGENWRETCGPTPATKVYCKRVRTIAEQEPLLLISHMYTRYLGDLFGGQMMGGMARSSLKLEAGRGTRFYEFDQISATGPFIERWYKRLNSLDLSEHEMRSVVDEANIVFSLNINIFDELEGKKREVARSVGRLMWKGVKGFSGRFAKKLVKVLPF